jgi:AcrR family transcriptional regulator
MPAKETQRERLLAGMLAVANRDGYAGASVSAVIAHAGVSRPTFYEHFTDRGDCFLAVHRDLSARLLGQIHLAVAEAPPESAPQAAMRRLIERAQAEPARARFLANEAMAAGPCALDARDETIGAIEGVVEAARAGLAPETRTPDLPTGALIGATHWLLAQRLRRGEHDLTAFAEEITRWIDSYDQPAGEHRWRTPDPWPMPRRSPHVSDLPTQPPPPLAPGRSRLPSEEIARNQRERILFATAEIAAEKGYTATTIADIIQVARVERSIFRSHFRDKQQAFLAAHELAFQQTIAIAAAGFSSAQDWPERVWQGIHAASQFIATHSIAYLVHVESHAVGAPAIERIEQSHAAFTIFLQDGNNHTTLPQTTTGMEAVIAAIFELGYRQFRRHNSPELPRYAYHCTYLALAPFLGPEMANELLDAKLPAGRRATAVRRASTGQAQRTV